MKLGEIKQEKKKLRKGARGRIESGQVPGRGGTEGAAPLPGHRGEASASRAGGAGTARLGSARLGEGLGAPCRV